MKNKLINIENIKLGIYSNILNENSNKSLINDFANLINEDEVLKYQYYTFKNIKEICKSGSKNINEDVIKELEFLNHFTESDYIKSQDKLKKYINEYKNDVVTDNIQVIIETYIFNKITPYNTKKINKLINEIVFYYENKQINEMVDDNTDINTDILMKHSYKKFNEKYNDLLNEEEKNIINIVNNNNMDEQKTLFNKTKNRVVNELKKDEEIEVDLLKEAITKINNMVYNSDSFLNDLIELNSLIS